MFQKINFFNDNLKIPAKKVIISLIQGISFHKIKKRHLYFSVKITHFLKYFGDKNKKPSVKVFFHNLIHKK